jgi:hypothetical protein
MVPALEFNPSKMRQFDRVPPLSPGRVVTIMSREGDDYIAVIHEPGVNSDGVYYGRLPASTVAVADTAQGIPDPVPPLPASGVKPRHVVPPPPPPPRKAGDLLASYGQPLGMIVALVAVIAAGIGYYLRRFTTFYAVNPSLWIFDGKTGEFLRIAKRYPDGRCTAESYSYAQRMAMVDADAQSIRRLGLGVTLLTCLTGGLIAWEQWGDISFGDWVGCAIAFGFMGSATLSVYIFAILPVLQVDRLGPLPQAPEAPASSPFQKMFG